MSICPDCGLSLTEPKMLTGKAPLVCPECLRVASPEPPEGWPIFSHWISTIRGRGVFTRRWVMRGEVLERCWVMPLSVEESVASLTMPVLNRYLFPWVDKQRALTTGAGLLYNFDRIGVTSRDPNTECVLRRGISAIEFRALRDIRSNEEVTWDYHQAKVRVR